MGLTLRSLLPFPATTAAVTSRATWRSLSCVGVTTPHRAKVVLPMTFPLFTSVSVIMPFSTLTRNCAGSGVRESARPSGARSRCSSASRHMANDIVAIAASMKIIVFISIDEKTTGRCAPLSRKISYYDGLQFADAKHLEQPVRPTAVVGKIALPLPWARARPRKSRGREEYSDRLVGFPSRQRVEQFQEAHGGFTIWLDPFGVLDPQVVVDLLPELDVGVDFVRHGNWLIWNVH